MAEGGFHFPQVLPSGAKVQLVASTKDELDAIVLDFRIKNSLPTGSPTHEVTDYLCGRWPRFCRAEEGGEADESAENKNLRQRTTNWKANRYAQTETIKELESDETATARAQVCVTCPKNQDNRSGCPPCVADNERVLFMIRQGRSTQYKDSLGGCDITGQDNETAAFLVPEMLKYADKFQEELPSYCWMKK